MIVLVEEAQFAVVKLIIRSIETNWQIQYNIHAMQIKKKNESLVIVFIATIM